MGTIWRALSRPEIMMMGQIAYLDAYGVVPPRQGVATIEAIATNAVMAGCRPEYMGVCVAAERKTGKLDFDVG